MPSEQDTDEVTRTPIAIRPAPGTCCPEQTLEDGRCTECGHEY